MKFKSFIVTAFAALLLSGGCVDDNILPEPDGAGDSLLRLDVQSFTVLNDDGTRASVPSANPEPESDQERKIRDFWMFQFDAAGNQIKDPKYYSGGDLNTMTSTAYTDLVADTPITIYIIANTGDESWVTGVGAAEFNTLEKVKNQHLRTPAVIQVSRNATTNAIEPYYIPMSGQVDNVTKSSSRAGLIVVPVTRMYAKVKIQAALPTEQMVIYDADVSNIPWYCRVSTIATNLDSNGDPRAAVYPSDIEWHSKALKSDQAIAEESGEWMVIYVPEVIRGECFTNKDTKTAAGLNADVEGVPDHALKVQVWAKYGGMDYYYTVYPGGNTWRDFNIQRNCVYRVKLDVKGTSDQHNPSSNCFIVKPGEMLAFEPYNRVETGGGYKFSDYLNPNDSKKKIAEGTDGLKIIWQTKDCIGDNTEGNLVKLGPATDNPVHRKIYVQTKTEGNALVGAYNSDGEIIWSWHIWVTKNEPDNLGNAVVYRTYQWDSGGIYPDKPRVPGYGIMQCNIGALEFRSEDDMPYEEPIIRPDGYNELGAPYYSISQGRRFPESQVRTFGMLYQWGRKDPFPPITHSTGTENQNGTLEYTNEFTDPHYANDNKTEVNKYCGYYSQGGWINRIDYLFYTHRQGNIDNATESIKFSIANPTVFISVARQSGVDYYGEPIWIFNTGTNGDWCGEGTEGLWGGTKGSDGLLINADPMVNLYKNYGEKSIFDPCPTGWRVPPGDLWLGFTNTGLNPIAADEFTKLPTFYEQINYSPEESGKRPGMAMYVQGWHTGPTLYFPLQGTRIYNGQCSNTGLCGNYHNATCDNASRVNILHLHRDMNLVSAGEHNSMLFNLFDFHEQYYAKSTAGPVRCVRDRK